MKDVEEALPLAGKAFKVRDINAEEGEEEETLNGSNSVGDMLREHSTSEEDFSTDESNFEGKTPTEDRKPRSESSHTMQCNSFEEVDLVEESPLKEDKDEFILIPKKLPKRFIILGTLAFVVMVTAVIMLCVLLSTQGVDFGSSSDAKAKAGSTSLANGTLAPDENSSALSCPAEEATHKECLSTQLTYIESKLCLACTTEAFNAITQKDSCAEKQSQFCNAFLDCTACGICYDSSEEYFDCLLGAECHLNCGAGLDGPTSSPAPTPVSLVCTAEKESYQECFVTELSKGDREACVKCTNEVLSNTVYDQDCSAFTESFCPAFNNCAECARCSDELESYVVCVSNMCDIDCQTIPREPALSPSAAPTVPRCVTEEDDYATCLLSDLVTAEDHKACIACVNSGLSNASFDSCDAFQGSFCPIFNSCTNCTLCYGEILSYIECGTACTVSCS